MAQTPATAFLATQGVSYTEHEFEYLEHGGTGHSSSAMGVPEHQVIKTLVMENERGDPLVVLMHGDRKVSTK
jgi:prolyl-tRNA editing enzyme YbaK/EbsC (Cys-tRNA(Pro) deacylase)